MDNVSCCPSGYDFQTSRGTIPIILQSKTLVHNYNFTRVSLSELLITDTELKLIAAAAIIGDNSIPKNGYNTPAATGTPATL